MGVTMVRNESPFCGVKQTVSVGLVCLLANASVAQTDSQRPVRIAGSAYLGDLPTFVAEHRGLFDAQGLEATVTHGEAGRGNMALLRAGETDFALMALTPLVLDRFADADPGQPDDPVILASLLQSYELTSVTTSPDFGVHRPSDFRGRRIAFEPRTSTEFVWWLFEKFHALGHDSVQRVELSIAEMPEALASGRIDGAVLPEPWGSQLENMVDRSGKIALRRFDARELYAGRWVLVTTRGRVRNSPDIARRVLGAYQQAIEFIERQPDDAIALYERSVNATDRIAPERWESLDYHIGLDWSLIAGLRQQIRWAMETRFDERRAPVPVLDFIAAGPLNQGWPHSVHIPAGDEAGEMR